MSKFLKSVLFCLIIFLGLFNFQTNTVNANNPEKTFIISAYCSPTPHDSIAYKKLNSQGDPTITASGKKVFKGLVAGPNTKNYIFGTKIYLKGFGVVEVQDRGCAVVEAGQEPCRGFKIPKYDRLDIWMGYGDECKKRAIQWGKKEVKGEIIAFNEKVNIEFGDKGLIKEKYKKENYNKLNKEVKIILNSPKIRLDGDNPQKEEVKKVQELFKKLGMYNGKIDGNFKNIRRRLLNFQKKAGIIENDNDHGAGWFGPKTKAALITYFENKQTPKKKKITLDDISYKALDKVSKKLKNSPKKDSLIKILENNLSKIKNTEHKKKIAYLILSLKKA